MSESTVSSSQEILFSSQMSDENSDCYQLSTQELINAQTQEASNASDFLLNLTPSQLMTTSSQESSPTKGMTQMTHIVIDIKPQMSEKRKRGRKRKIRNEEEMVVHLKDKKEKNRLAAQRLRQRKCSEGQKYDKLVKEYERMVKIKKNFANHLESKVDQLRNRIRGLSTQSTTDDNRDDNESESKSQSNHLICISL